MTSVPAGCHMVSLRTRIVIALLLLIAFCTSTLAHSQESTPARRRIGLALSGGGALGLAHIGVLKYFEEHRVPVDVVAGTSMGGLVGGLYATGLSSVELDEIARKADWNDLLRAVPKFQDRPVAEKQSWNRATSGLTLQLGRGLSLPTGLNSGQPLALMLSRYTAPYAHVESFDDLPIPFRCVATDLVSGEPFVLGRGSLPLALRATMAIPGAFTPVNWENTVLVDGGVVNNIPTEVVKKVGADVVIAVSLETPPVKASDLNNLAVILRQVVSVSVLQNERRSLKLADIVIPVQFQKFTATDYDQAQEIIALGYRAAQSQARVLKQYELAESEWQAYIAEREGKIRRSPISGHVIAVQSSQRSILRDARDEIARKLPRDVSTIQLDDTLSGITAASGLPAAYYGFRNDDGGRGFEIALEERPTRTTLLRPTFFLQLSAGEPSRTRLRLDSTTIWKNAYKSRLLANLTVGYDPALHAEYYAPIGGSSYFVAPGFVLQREHFESYEGRVQSDKVRDRFAGSFYAGVGTWRFLQVRLGATAGFDRYETHVVTDGVVARSSPFVNPEIVGIINTQDSGAFPTHGFRMNTSAGYSQRDHSYPYFRTDFSNFHKLPGTFGVFFTGRSATSFGEKLPFYEQFTAGGFSQLDAYRYQEFRANTLVLGGAGATYRIPRFKRTQWKPTLATWYQAGRFDLGSNGWETHQSASIGAFASTPLGVTGLAVSFDENGRARLRLSVGVF